MPEKPGTAAAYPNEHTRLVRATCLYVATKLGDLMDDPVVVGGLVPSLLIDQEDLAEGAAAHVGTMDLDVGLTIALLDEGRYCTLTERRRRAGFSQDVNDEGNPTRQRWQLGHAAKVTADFLIPPSRPAIAAVRCEISSPTSPPSSRRGFIWRSRTAVASRSPVRPSWERTPRATSGCVARAPTWS